jgi:asparagine N-glycosylation enzyme membrane subunit Stt3
MKNLFFVLAIVFSSLAFANHPKAIKLELNQEKATDFHYYNFGIVPVNYRTFVDYTVTNTGTTPLFFQRATIAGAYFGAYHTCRNGLMPNQQCAFRIEYWPTLDGYHTGQFYLTFDQGSEILVNVSGQANR